jgi:hypothetical protein
VRAFVHAVLNDIDDTLAGDGRLSAIAHHALERLQQAGFAEVAVVSIQARQRE